MKKKVLLSVLLLSLTFLWGCGVELTGKVSLNKDFSGTRTMACTFSSSDFLHHFDGTKEDLDQLIEDSCPKVLTYKKASRDGMYSYTFSLKFSSLKDYQEKTEELLHFAPKITYQYGDSPFVSGLIYKENFSSRDLMAWLYTALYEKKYIDDNSVSDLWDLKKTTISFLGKTYETKDKISIDEMKYAELSSIRIHTEPKEDGSLFRTIKFYIPQKTLDQNSGKIRSYFEGYETSWQSQTDGKILTASFSADTFSNLTEKTREILHSNSSFGTYKVTSKQGKPFQFQTDYEEFLDLTNFIQENGTVPVIYTFEDQTLLDEKIKEKDIKFSSDHTQKLSSYDIITVWNSKDDLRRKMSLIFDFSCNEVQLAKLKAAFRGTTISKVTLEGKQKKTLSFEQHGSVEECNKDLSSVFQGCSLKLKESSSLFRGTTVTLEDQISLSTESDPIPGTYTFVSIQPNQSVTVDATPDKQVQSSHSQNTVSRSAAALLKSDETVTNLCTYQLKSDQMKVIFQGKTASTFWSSALKWILPLALIIFFLIFIAWKQAFIVEKLNQGKEYLEQWIKKHKM